MDRLCPGALPSDAKHGMQGRRAELKTQFEALAKLDSMDMNGVFLWTNSNEDIVYSIANRPILERFVAADPLDRWSRLALAEVLVRTEEAYDAEKSQEILKPFLGKNPLEHLFSPRSALEYHHAQRRVAKLANVAARGEVEHDVHETNQR